MNVKFQGLKEMEVFAATLYQHQPRRLPHRLYTAQQLQQ